MIKNCKIIILTVILIITMSCVSCSHVPENYLLYQNFPLEIDAIMTYNGTKYDVFMSVTGIGEGALIYKTPLTLEGYRYDVANGEITVTYERLVMKLAEGSSHPAETAINMFTLLPEEMISAELVNHNGIKLNCIQYQRDRSIITVWCTADNVPVRIQTDTLSLDITNFKGNMLNE